MSGDEVLAKPAGRIILLFAAWRRIGRGIRRGKNLVGHLGLGFSVDELAGQSIGKVKINAFDVLEQLRRLLLADEIDPPEQYVLGLEEE